MENILYEKKEGIGFMRFNRPEALNSLNDNMVANLVKKLREAINDEEIKVIIISSVGDRAFCVGDDLKEMVQNFENIYSGKKGVNDVLEGLIEDLQEFARLIRNAPKAVIAAVKGYAVGGGCEIALDCDLIIAADNAQFGFPEVTAGMSITGGITKLLPLYVGLAKAKELCLTGEFIDAQEAYRIGLVNKVVPLGKEEIAAEDMARTIMQRGPLSIKAHKSLLNLLIDAEFDTALELEKKTIGVLLTTQDAREAVNSFVQKRKPEFKGK